MREQIKNMHYPFLCFNYLMKLKKVFKKKNTYNKLQLQVHKIHFLNKRVASNNGIIVLNVPLCIDTFMMLVNSGIC